MNTQTHIDLNGKEAEQVFTILYDFGLNWEVQKKPLFGPDGERTTSAGIFKGDDGQHLGTVSPTYEPVQNAQLCELLVKASQDVPVNFNNGGSFKEGRLIYLQADLPDEFVGRSGIKRKLTAINSHDGSTSLAFGSSNLVLWCQNQFHRMYKDLQKFRHTSNIHTRINNAALQINAALREDAALIESFAAMDGTVLRDEMIEGVINAIFKLDAKGTDKEALSTRKKNQIQSFADALTTEVRDQGKTVWALFNGVTRYTNHSAAPSDPDKKDDYLMNGGGYNLGILGFEECLKWIDEKPPLELV